MLINLILYGSAYIIVPIMCACMLMAAKSEKTVILGVSIPKEHSQDEEILHAIKGYKKEVWIITAIVALIPIPACFINGFTISMTVWMLWLTAAIAGYAYPYAKYHKKIRKIKFQKQWSISTLDGSDQCEDDDEHWIGGMLYYNPDDKRNFIEKKVGIGTTVNLATKVGKAIIAFTVICLLSMPAILIFCGLDEYTPISYKYENQQLVFSHVMTKYVIDENNIDNVALIDQLPKRSRLNGTGLDNLQKGLFSVTGYGKCKLCLNPENGEFIVIRTKDGLTYIFSARDDSGTLELYEMLSKIITAPAY